MRDGEGIVKRFVGMGKKKGNNECGEEKVKKVRDLICGMGRREREERRK